MVGNARIGQCCGDDVGLGGVDSHGHATTNFTVDLNGKLDGVIHQPLFVEGGEGFVRHGAIGRLVAKTSP